MKIKYHNEANIFISLTLSMRNLLETITTKTSNPTRYYNNDDDDDDDGCNCWVVQIRFNILMVWLKIATWFYRILKSTQGWECVDEYTCDLISD